MAPGDERKVMLRLKKFLMAILAIYLAAAALSLPPAEAAPATTKMDSIRVTFRDGYDNWETIGDVTSGNVTISPASTTSLFFSVTGTVTRPGLAGGTATITFDVRAFFELGFGKVTVSDPSVALHVSVPVFFRHTVHTPSQASGSASWFNPGFKGFYQFSWVVNDEA